VRCGRVHCCAAERRGLILELREGLHDQFSQRLQCGRFSRGPQQRVQAALAVGDEWTCGEGNVWTFASFPHGEADQLQTAKHAFFFEQDFDVRQLGLRNAAFVWQNLDPHAAS
jgi:hypothetical protein